MRRDQTRHCRLASSLRHSNHWFTWRSLANRTRQPRSIQGRRGALWRQWPAICSQIHSWLDSQRTHETAINWRCDQQFCYWRQATGWTSKQVLGTWLRSEFKSRLLLIQRQESDGAVGRNNIGWRWALFYTDSVQKRLTAIAKQQRNCRKETSESREKSAKRRTKARKVRTGDRKAAKEWLRRKDRWKSMSNWPYMVPPASFSLQHKQARQAKSSLRLQQQVQRDLSQQISVFGTGLGQQTDWSPIAVPRKAVCNYSRYWSHVFADNGSRKTPRCPPISVLGKWKTRKESHNLQDDSTSLWWNVVICSSKLRAKEGRQGFHWRFQYWCRKCVTEQFLCGRPAVLRKEQRSSNHNCTRNSRATEKERFQPDKVWKQRQIDCGSVPARSASKGSTGLGPANKCATTRSSPWHYVESRVGWAADISKVEGCCIHKTRSP